MTAEIDRRIRWLVSLGSGLDFDSNVIEGNDDHPPPAGLFASVLRIEDRERGLKHVTYRWDADELSNTADVLSFQRGTFDVQFWRTGATEAATRLMHWLGTPEGLMHAGRTGMTIGSYGPVRRIDHLVADETEERAGIDLEADWTYSFRQDAGVIRSVPMTVADDAIEQTADVTAEQ